MLNTQSMRLWFSFGNALDCNKDFEKGYMRMYIIRKGWRTINIILPL